jgi:hypothetical protein
MDDQPGIRLTFWGVNSDLTDEEGRSAYLLKFGKFPTRVIRFDKCVLLLGPIVEDDEA